MYTADWKFFKQYKIALPTQNNVVKYRHMNSIQKGVLPHLMFLATLPKKRPKNDNTTQKNSIA